MPETSLRVNMWFYKETRWTCFLWEKGISMFFCQKVHSQVKKEFKCNTVSTQHSRVVSDLCTDGTVDLRNYICLYIFSLITIFCYCKGP